MKHPYSRVSGFYIKAVIDHDAGDSAVPKILVGDVSNT